MWAPFHPRAPSKKIFRKAKIFQGKYCSGIIIVYTYGILPPSSAEASVGYGGRERYYTVFSGKLLNGN
jgi:hypothetical protein